MKNLKQKIKERIRFHREEEQRLLKESRNKGAMNGFEEAELAFQHAFLRTELEDIMKEVGL